MEELDLKELISMFLEKKILIILVVIIFALIGAIYTLKFVTPIYQSSTSLILAQTNLNGQGGETNSITASDITLNANLVDNYKEIAESRIVAAKVIQNLGLSDSIEAIQASTSVSTSSDTEVLKITVSNRDPELACKIANELATVFTEQALEIYKVNNVNVLDEAVVSSKPANVNLFKNVIIFAFVGGVLVAGYILLINMLDTTVKTDLDIERTVHLPVLASIVLTEDTPKKKKSKSSYGKRSRSSLDIDFNPVSAKTLQDFNNAVKEENNDDNISMFSYMHKDEEKEVNNVKQNNNNNNKNRNYSNKPKSESNGSSNSRRRKNSNNNRKGGNK